MVPQFQILCGIVSKILCIRLKKDIMTKITLISIALFHISIASFCQGKDGYDIVEHNDLSYLSEELVSDDNLQKLNLILPVKNDNFPLLIWIGGGAWSYVDRNQEMDLARKFAKKGIGVASVGHRLSPAIWKDSTLNSGIQHPKHIEDVAASVTWLNDNAAKYGYDKDNIFIGGFSSGGHLSALICLDSTYLNKVGLSTSIFKGVIPISGAYDIIDYHEVLLNGGRPELAKLHVEAVFGSTVEGFKKASPSTYLDNLSTPMLLVCDNDLYNYTKFFEDRIRETEFRDVQVVYSYNLSHGGLWRDMSFSEKSMYREIIINFIEAHFGKG